MNLVNKLKKILQEGYETFTFSEGDLIIYIHVNKLDTSYRILSEGNQRGDISLNSQYSANYHRAHVPGSQPHLHIYSREKELFAVNRDGSGKDGSSGKSIPNKVAKAIQKKFPEFSIPTNKILESDVVYKKLINDLEVLNEAT